VVRHLRPLAIATNSLQSVSCRLDTVLVTFGFLLMQFTRIKSPANNPDWEEEKAACDRVINSLEKRWAKADQILFLAALILNPSYGFTLFDHSNAFLSQRRVINYLRVLWMRLFQHAAPAELETELMDYFKHEGIFCDLKSAIEFEENQARVMKRDINPMLIYESLRAPGAPDTHLMRLARHLFSAATNSASCERLFSAFGNLLTKLRNKLGLKNMKSIAEL
ncbi:hypothetical protein FA15DRAFT_548268, partial [Coprinopsis marcescibilis]